MKTKGGVICIALLLIGLLTISPAIGSTLKANNSTQQIHLFGTHNDLVTIDIIFCTGGFPIQKEITIPRSEWDNLRNELKIAAASSSNLKDTLNAQCTVFKNHHIISETEDYSTIIAKAVEKSKQVNLPLWTKKITAGPILNNSVFSAMCAINFELTNGTTGVFGLNTFINYVGFDIISFHYGYAIDGIETNGLFSTKKTDPGNYVGFMFGFLGAWSGEKISTGFYSNVTIAGFSVITAWLPIQQT